MNQRNFNAAAIAAVCGAALLAVMPFAASTAAAADLPITKAPPKSLDSASPFWAEIDYLAWSVKGDRPPPLVTTSPGGTPPPSSLASTPFTALTHLPVSAPVSRRSSPA